MEEKTFEVDGIIFTRDGDTLIMHFKVQNEMHVFKIKHENARIMGENLMRLYASDKN